MVEPARAIVGKAHRISEGAVRAAEALVGHVGRSYDPRQHGPPEFTGCGGGGGNGIRATVLEGRRNRE